jgi:hypothetical protein
MGQSLCVPGFLFTVPGGLVLGLACFDRLTIKLRPLDPKIVSSTIGGQVN